jgi:hypothetical protein
MNHMHLLEMEYLMECEMREAVTRHFPLDWKEDAITHDLMIRLRDQFRQTTLYGARLPIELEWEIYKFHGKRETAYGDIGLLLRYRMPTGGTIDGAGFLEAKVRGRDTTKFPQVRHEQVTRILARSPQTRLLLYDYNAVAVLNGSDDVGGDWDFPHPFRRRRSAYAHVTHGPVLPLQLAATVNQYDDTLYRFCHSFSHQFTRRYFNLHDLDFTDQAVRAVQGFPSELGSPNVIMVVRAAPLGQELPEGFRPNDNTYGAIG